MTKAKSDQDDSMRILKTATCKSVTGKSTLTYQIGRSPDSAVHIRISKNTGAGFFSDEWIALEDAHRALETAYPVTSIVLQPLFKGKSANTPGFLLAVLVKERLLRPLKGKKRNHELPEEFKARVDSLMASGVKPKGATRKTTGASTKKAAVRKKSAASRRRKAGSVRGS